MSIFLEIKGAENIKRNLKKMDENYSKELSNVIDRIALMIESEAVNLIKTGIPPPLSEKTLQAKLRKGFSAIPLIRTGELLQSIRSVKISNFESEVGGYSPYAIYHEFGAPSIKLPQRPFLLPAVDNILPQVENEVEIMFKKVNL